LSQRIHIILDNYSTHKHPVVKRWLARHPRFELHFTPTGSSWMNLVERFFRDLSQQAILPGSFGSVRQLVDAIYYGIPCPPQPPSQALRLESQRRGDPGEDRTSLESGPWRRQNCH
jgi:hypothetical protein